VRGDRSIYLLNIKYQNGWACYIIYLHLLVKNLGEDFNNWVVSGERVGGLASDQRGENSPPVRCATPGTDAFQGVFQSWVLPDL
jgi:hypothetical protein